MTYEEYEKTHYERPYKLRIESGPNSLFYLGEAHSFDPDDPQWDEVRSFWEEFLQATKGGKRIAFVEGGKRRIKATERESIEHDGGMGLITWLAREAGIDTYSPEPVLLLCPHGSSVAEETGSEARLRGIYAKSPRV